MSESGCVTAAPGSIPPELGYMPINGPIDDKQSIDLDRAVHGGDSVCLSVRMIKPKRLKLKSPNLAQG